MSAPDRAEDGIELDFDLEAPPQKVWRAISTPGLREAWLPGTALADAEADAVTPGQEIRYRLRDDEPPHFESLVTFTIVPNGEGGTRLRIVQELCPPARETRLPSAVNDDRRTWMRAA